MVPATGHTLASTDSRIYAKQQAEALSIPSGSGIPYGWCASIIANATTLGTGSVAITPTAEYPNGSTSGTVQLGALEAHI